ncbi:MAG: LLM class flavin-dependent oxidoreductase [Frankia sp.]
MIGIGVSSAVGGAPRAPRLSARADGEGRDLLTVSGHRSFSDRLDVYAVIGVALVRTTRIAGLVSVTHLPSRSAPVLAPTITSLLTLFRGRVVLGFGVGRWEEIIRLGALRLAPEPVVRAFEEAIALVQTLSGEAAK